MAKIPAVAAVLNLIIWGLGYIYLRKKTKFGILLVVGYIVSFSAIASPSAQTEMFGNPILYISSLGTIIIGIAFALDAYRMAKGIAE